MAALRELLASFGVQVDTASLLAADKKIVSFKGTLLKLGAALASGAAIQGLRGLTEEIRHQGDELDKVSKRYNVTTQELQAYRHAANLSGVATQVADDSLKFLAKNLADVATVGGPAKDALDGLGVSAQDAEGNIRRIPDVLPDIAESFKNIKDPGAKAQIAMKLFGEAGVKLIPMLNEGADGVRSMLAELEELGGGISQEAIDASVQLTDETARMDLAMTSLKSTLALAIIPAMTWFTTKVKDTVVWIGKLVKETNVLKAVTAIAAGAGIALMIKYAGAISKALVLMLRFAKPVALIALLVLLVEDLITWWEGGDSAIGRFLDAVFGLDASKIILEGLKGLVEDLGYAWQITTEIIQWVWSETTAFLSSAWDATVTAISDAIEALPASWDAMIAAFVGAWDSAVGSITGIWDSAVSFIADKIEMVMGFAGKIQDLGKRVAGFFGADVGDVNVTRNDATVPRSVVSPVTNTANVNQENRTTINVNGTGNPREVAARVVDAQRSATLRNERSAAFAALIPGAT